MNEWTGQHVCVCVCGWAIADMRDSGGRTVSEKVNKRSEGKNERLLCADAERSCV